MSKPKWDYLRSLPDKPNSDLLSIEKVIWSIETRRQRVEYREDNMERRYYLFSGSRVMEKAYNWSDGGRELYSKDGFFYEYKDGDLVDKMQYFGDIKSNYSYEDDSSFLLKIERPLISENNGKLVREKNGIALLELTVGKEDFETWLTLNECGFDFLSNGLDKQYRKKYGISLNDELKITSVFSKNSAFPITFNLKYNIKENVFKSVSMISSSGEFMGEHSVEFKVKK